MKTKGKMTLKRFFDSGFFLTAAWFQFGMACYDYGKGKVVPAGVCLIATAFYLAIGEWLSTREKK